MTDFERKIRRSKVKHEKDNKNYIDYWLERQDKQYIYGYFIGKYRPSYPIRADLGIIYMPIGGIWLLGSVMMFLKIIEADIELFWKVIITSILTVLSIIGVLIFFAGLKLHLRYTKQKEHALHGKD